MGLSKALQEFIGDFYASPEEITHIEHYGKPIDEKAANSVSPAGARGLMQVMPITLKDWNQEHPEEQYTLDDLFKPQVNTKLGYWQANERIPQFFMNKGIPLTKENVLATYNTGIGNFSDHYFDGANLHPQTQEYLRRFKQEKYL